MMPEWATPILNALIPALFLAVVTSVLTVRLSLRRFRTERMWERKADAYSRIIEALHHMTEYCLARSEEYMQVRKPTPEREIELQDNYRAADAALRTATGIGAFIISEEVAGLLLSLEGRAKLSWQETDAVALFGAEFDAYKRTLTQIRRLAKKDLRIS